MANDNSVIKVKKQLYDFLVKKYNIAKGDKSKIREYNYIKKIYLMVNNLKNIDEVFSLFDGYIASPNLQSFQSSVINEIIENCEELKKKYHAPSNISFYNNTVNQFDPANNVNDMQKLFSLYKDYSAIPILRKDGYDTFYSKLVKENAKYSGRYSKTFKDEFNALIFNKWKNSLTGMYLDEFNKLKQKGSLSDDIIDLISYLKGIPDLKTQSEVERVLLGANVSENLKKVIKKYYPISYNERENNFEHTNWYHVISTHLTGDKNEYFMNTSSTIEHRLYLNIDSLVIHEFSTSLMALYDKYNMPYYFKFNEFTNRADKFVIYSSTKDLSKHIKILQELAQTKPHLMKYIYEPNLFSGVVNGWIGYGSQPKSNDESFNSKRSVCCCNAISKSLKEYLKNNLNKKYIHDGLPVSLYNAIIDALAEDLSNSINNHKVSKHSIKNELKRKLNINDFVSKMYDFPNKNNDLIININNCEYVRGARYLECFFSTEILQFLSKNDPAFISFAQGKLKEELIKHDINPEKMCFDNDKKKLIENYENNVSFKNTKYELHPQLTLFEKVRQTNEAFKKSPDALKQNKSLSSYYDGMGNDKNIADIITMPGGAETSFGKEIIKYKVYKGERPNVDISTLNKNQIIYFFENTLKIIQSINIPKTREEIINYDKKGINPGLNIKMKYEFIKAYLTIYNRCYRNFDRSDNYLNNLCNMFTNEANTFVFDIKSLENSNVRRNDGSKISLVEVGKSLEIQNKINELLNNGYGIRR